MDFGQMVRTARTAERGLFDLLFLADSGAVSVSGTRAVQVRMGKTMKFKPVTALFALAALTSRIGLVGTVSSTFHDPYIPARQFASMDQISGGRMGWNLVTSDSEAEALNHSRDAHPAHAGRYERATEFAAVVQGLWDGWEDDAHGPAYTVPRLPTVAVAAELGGFTDDHMRRVAQTELLRGQNRLVGAREQARAVMEAALA